MSATRRTRSGTVFSPFSALTAATFDFAAALVKSVAREPMGPDGDDHEDSDDDEEPERDPSPPEPFHLPSDINDFVPLLPPPLQPWEEPPVERSPSPPPCPSKRTHTTIDDMHDDEEPEHDPSPPEPLHPSSDIDDFVPPLPPPLQPWEEPHPWNDIDEPAERSPSPPPRPPKCARTTIDDMREGKKPQTKAHRNRKEKRRKKVAEEGHVPRLSALRKHATAPLADPLRVDLDAAALHAAHSAYAAKVEGAKEKRGSKKPRPRSELIRLGFQVVRWNGIDSRPLVDARGRIFAVLVGQPRGDPGWDAAVSDAFRHISAEGRAANFPAFMAKHRRGLFAVLNVGLTYGKGQTVPSRLFDSNYAGIIDRLLGNLAIQRMASYADAAFAAWAPRLYKYYHEHDTALRKHLPHLPRNFAGSVFSCAAFNFGPSVWTFRHRDVLNVPFGWCAIQAAGNFDATQGGHLVLWDLKMVIEFPHGALILLPSATIAHSNVPVKDNEERISFTQFTAGGLIRYVDNGFRTEGELADGDPAEFERLAALKESRWELGLGLFSTLDEMLKKVEVEE
ncbi:hypothetical protein B0H17DRAFT_1138539 [Mycena rosella]|uniref:Uncharacterized protein n=1 Tax=Mycena rosella TaxID=1033263 RepID=A0AAD7D6F4_MYCRO|nr:hypothetical protein B0H17DRAFT_1138539 [Mycena rosella]